MMADCELWKGRGKMNRTVDAELVKTKKEIL